MCIIGVWDIESAALDWRSGIRIAFAGVDIEAHPDLGCVLPAWIQIRHV